MINLEEANKAMRHASPSEIISWALQHGKKPIITTNFRPYAAAILDAVVCVKKDIDVVWIDTGYNTPQTYKHAIELIARLKLNIHSYIPLQTAAFRDTTLGIPSVEEPSHALFTEQVKLEPFKRAMKIHEPDVWFTNLRKGQTAFRDKIDVFSYSKDGILKVSPFYHYSDTDLDQYLIEKKLPNEFKYFDPTKQLSNRECGLHQ